MKTSDFTIWPTSHPIARAASFAVFVPSGNRRTSGSKPWTRAASRNRSIAPLTAPLPAAVASSSARAASSSASRSSDRRASPSAASRPNRSTRDTTGTPSSRSPSSAVAAHDGHGDRQLATEPQHPGRHLARGAIPRRASPRP